MRYVWLLRGYKKDVSHISTALYSLYINNVGPEDGLESPKHVEHPKIKIGYKNLCIFLAHFHIAV